MNKKDLHWHRDNISAMQTRLDSICVLAHSCVTVEDHVSELHQREIEKTGRDTGIHPGLFAAVEVEIVDRARLARDEIDRFLFDYVEEY